MVSCPVCQHPNLTGAKVCQSCGSPLRSPTGMAGLSFALPVGTTLFNGRYVIERELGAGGFGITYKATDTLLSRPVAIKEFFLSGQCVRQGRSIVPMPTVSPQDYQAFRRAFIEEAQVLARIKHPNKVEVYDVFEENNTAYMVMEFVEGKNLLRLLEERGGVMDEREAIGYITQVAGALEAMHQAGYLHRDIKPENIMVTRDGRAVLIDFGAARQFITQKTKTMESVLTPGYAPLEQYTTRARFGPPLDIYALGATLYHLLTGQVPPAAPDRAQGVDLIPPHQLNPKISRQVSEAVVKAMAMRVDERPQSVREFINLLTGTSVSASAAPKAPAPPAQKVTWQEIGAFGWHGRSVRSVAFSPDEKFLASGSEDNKVKVREVGSWREVAILEHGSPVLSISFSPDGRFLASGCKDRKVRIWLTGGPWPEFATFQHGSAVWAVSFSPDGIFLASGCEDGTVNVWEVGSRRRIAYRKHGNWVTSLAFSPDGTSLASGGNEGIKIWDVGNWAERAILPYEGQVVFSIAFSPDGKFLASGSGFGYATMWGRWEWKGGEIKVWEVGSWREVIALRKGIDVVMSVTFTPDGRFLVAGSYDGKIKVLEVGSWQEVTTLSGRRVYSVCLSPNGGFLALGNADGTIKLWEISGLQMPVKKPLTRQPQVIISQPTPKPVYRKAGGVKKGTITGARDPVVAGLLSFFFPGAGQIYNGQIAKGLPLPVLFLLTIILVNLAERYSLHNLTWALIGALSSIIYLSLWIISIIDAVKIAKKLKQGQSVSEWEWF